MTRIKLLLSLGAGNPGTHPIHGFWGPPESIRKQHLDRFDRFCRAHGCDRHTDIHTQSTDIGDNRPHLALCIAIQSNNNNKYSK